MACGQVIVHGTLRGHRLAAQGAVVGKQAGEVDRLDVIADGHAARKPLATKRTLKVAQAGDIFRRLHHILEQIVGRRDPATKRT